MLFTEPASKVGLKGRDARAGRPVRPRAEGEELGGGLLGEDFIPGDEGALDRIRAALGWSGEKTFFRAEEVHVEIREGLWGRFWKEYQLAGRSGQEWPFRASLTWVAKPLATKKIRYRFPGWGSRGRCIRTTGRGGPSCRS